MASKWRLSGPVTSTMGEREAGMGPEEIPMGPGRACGIERCRPWQDLERVPLHIKGRM